MDRVIEVALADISERVNVEVGLGSDPDKRIAVEAFRILYRAGYVFRRLDVEYWAMANGWTPLAAIGLGAVAEAVNEGQSFHLQSKGPALPDGILDTWRDRARRRA